MCVGQSQSLSVPSAFQPVYSTLWTFLVYYVKRLYIAILISLRSWVTAYAIIGIIYYSERRVADVKRFVRR